MESRCSSCSGVSDGLQYKQALHMSPDGCNSNRKLCHWASCPAVLSETQTPGGRGQDTNLAEVPKVVSLSFLPPPPPPLLQRVPNTDARKDLQQRFLMFSFLFQNSHASLISRSCSRARTHIVPLSLLPAPRRCFTVTTIAGLIVESVAADQKRHS